MPSWATPSAPASTKQLHLRYKPDDNAQGRAERLARERYPAANHAAEAVVKYPLQRPDAPGLASGEQRARSEETASADTGSATDAKPALKEGGG